MKFPCIFYMIFLICKSSAKEHGAGEGALINIGGVVSGIKDAVDAAVGVLTLDDGPLGIMFKLWASSLKLIGVDAGVRSLNGGAPDEDSPTDISEAENSSNDTQTTTSSSEGILTNDTEIVAISSGSIGDNSNLTKSSP